MNEKLIKTKSKTFYELRDYIMIAIGTLLYTGGVSMFMLPYGLTTGGVSGVASIIYYTTNIPVSISYGSINLIFLAIAVKVLGWRFCMKTIAGVSFSTMWYSVWQFLLCSADNVWPQFCGDQIFMACIIGPAICGLGLNICFENNGSTGGTDIIAAIINKYKDVSLGQIILLCDILIISSCYFVFHDVQRVIFGYVMMIVCAMTLDAMTRYMHQAVRFEIFSRNYSHIADEINNEGFGTTVLDGFGWYTKTERKVLICICSKRYQDIIMHAIKRVDPYAFVSISNVNNVYGEGFSTMKAKIKNQKPILVFTTNDESLLAKAHSLLDGKFEIRSLSDVGCSEAILPNTHENAQDLAREQAMFVNKYYGFDTFASITTDNGETSVALIYNRQKYFYENIEQMAEALLNF